MREQLRDRERLEHILAAIERIVRYTSNKSFDDLVSDDMMYYAVVKNQITKYIAETDWEKWNNNTITLK